VDDLVLDPGSSKLGGLLESNTVIRRSALEDSFKTFGCPIMQRVSGENLYRAGMQAALGTCKYASIILFEDFAPWQFLPLLTLRQNIYTDPQKPLQVEAGIYDIGEPDQDAPVFVTTNFSLTYFIVSSEIESTGVPSRLMIVDVEGMSVLTAWSAGKFGGADVAKAVKESGIEERIGHRKVIIPGYVSVISGELEDELSGWEVMVGPQEASDIGSYVKEVWNA
jgi:acetyl-CoA decarbonylase/synthase complex subunit gamma